MDHNYKEVELIEQLLKVLPKQHSQQTVGV
jgi:hypothetical protein